MSVLRMRVLYFPVSGTFGSTFGFTCRECHKRKVFFSTKARKTKARLHWHTFMNPEQSYNVSPTSNSWCDSVWSTITQKHWMSKGAILWNFITSYHLDALFTPEIAVITSLLVLLRTRHHGLKVRKSIIMFVTLLSAIISMTVVPNLT